MKRCSENPYNDALSKELQLKKVAVASQRATIVQLVRTFWIDMVPREFAVQEPNEPSEDMLSCDEFEKKLNASHWANIYDQSEFLLEMVKLSGRISIRIRMLSFRFGQPEFQEMKQVMQIILAGTRGIFHSMVELSDMDEKKITGLHSS